MIVTCKVNARHTNKRYNNNSFHLQTISLYVEGWQKLFKTLCRPTPMKSIIIQCPRDHPIKFRVMSNINLQNVHIVLQHSFEYSHLSGI